MTSTLLGPGTTRTRRWSAPPTPGSGLSGLALAALLLGAFLAITDFFIVNVALDDIQTTLHASSATLELVVTGYGLAYALLLVAGGRLGDRLGRRQMFLAGMAAFIVASLACGLAPNAGSLVAMRVVQGMTSALMVPQVLATISATTVGQERMRALGFFGATAGIAAVVGQVVGGALVSADLFGTGWRPVFLVNVPVGLAGLVLAARTIPDSRSAAPARHDWVGTGLLGVALITLLLPLMEGRLYGWPVWTWVSLAIAPVALAGFALTEHRIEQRGGVPLVPLTLLPSMWRGLVMVLLFFGSFGGFMFAYTIAAQQGLGLEPWQTGLLLAPEALVFLAATLLAPRLVARWGRTTITIGSAIMATGLGLTAWTWWAGFPDVDYALLCLSLVVVGAGQGLVAPALINTVLSGVPTESAGAGSGVLSTTQQTAFALGVATLGNVYLAQEADPGKALGIVLVAQGVVIVAVAGLSRVLPRRA
jgi:MFS family permease